MRILSVLKIGENKKRKEKNQKNLKIPEKQRKKLD